MADNKVILKRSSVAAKVPQTSDLEYGELAVNYNDGRIYYKDSSNAIQYFERINSTDDLSEGSSNLYYTDSRVNSRIDTRVDKSFVDALGIDASTLDGQTPGYYLDYDNFTNIPTIGDGTLTVSGGTGLSGSGTFNANQTSNNTITLNNSDRGSSQAIFKNVAVSGETTINADNNTDTLTFIEGSNIIIETDSTNKAVTITATGTGSNDFVDSGSFDTLNGELTLTRTDNGTIVVDLDGRYLLSDGTADNSLLLDGENGSYYLNYNNFTNTPTIGDGTLTVEGGNGLTGSGTFDANTTTNNTITIDHSNTSSQSSVDNSGGTVVQDVTLDGFGHVTSLGSADLDSRYYTQSTADSTFVAVSGDTMTGFLTLNDDPTNNLHAATKRYVDEVAQGLNVKPSDYVATTQDLPATYSTTNNTLTADSNGAISIDGTTLSVGETVLVKDQSDSYENGSYEVTQVGDSSNPWILTRTQFMDETIEIAGAFEFVENGNTNAATGWVATVPSDFELNNTNSSADSDFTTRGDIVWVQFSGSGTFTAGSGLDLSGTEFSHADTSSVSNLSASSNTFVDGLSFDSFGHVTSVSTSSVVSENDFVDGATFSTSNGELTLSRSGTNSLADITVDLDGRYLLTSGTATDSNLLENESGSYYLNYNNFTNTPTIGDAQVSITGGNALTGSGTFNLNDTSSSSITINHEDTSTQNSVNNSGGTVVQDIGVDDYGHVTSIGSKSLSAGDVGALSTTGKAADADLLDGENGTYYLNYNNFTNTPTLYDSSDFNTDFSSKSTSDLSEGTSNLYFTESRARSSVSGSTGISYNSSTGSISIDNTVATLSDTQTLTNKTLDLTDNTLDTTLSQLNSGLSDATLITEAPNDGDAYIRQNGQWIKTFEILDVDGNVLFP